MRPSAGHCGVDEKAPLAYDPFTRRAPLGRTAHPALRHRSHSPLADSALAAARPLAGQSHAATLGWDGGLVIRGLGGAVANVFGSAPRDAKGRSLGDLFEDPSPLADALHFGISRNLRLQGGEVVRVEAGPCPGGAVAIVRRSTADELELTRLVSALGHELRNAFASVLLAVQSLGRQGEVSSERGRRRLQLAERELRRIECVLRGLKEMGRTPVSRPVEVLPERLAREAIASLGPEPGGEHIRIEAPDADGPAALLDGPRIRLALEELLRHAVRAVSPSGMVRLHVDRLHGELRYVVEAKGPEATHPNAEDLAKGGTDLGLAVAEAVARTHGGFLSYEHDSTGCRLLLVLPQRPVTT